MKLEEVINKIQKERARQLDLPGSEWDSKNTPGEWVAIATHYVSDEVRRNGQLPSKEAFSDSLVKAAAIIIAALENIEVMTSRNELT